MCFHEQLMGSDGLIDDEQETIDPHQLFLVALKSFVQQTIKDLKILSYIRLLRTASLGCINKGTVAF